MVRDNTNRDMTTEETKPKRTRRTPDEIARELRERADRTERQGQLDAVKADPIGAKVYAARVALTGTGATGHVQLDIDAALAKIDAALVKLGHDPARL